MEHRAEQPITILRGGRDYARVTLRGHIDHHTARRLRTELGAVLDTGARYVTVDVVDVTWCDEISCGEQNVPDVLGGRQHVERARSRVGWRCPEFITAFDSPPDESCSPETLCRSPVSAGGPAPLDRRRVRRGPARWRWAW